MKRHGFTLVELLVVIAIIATLAALLLSGLKTAKDASKVILCLGNARQIALGTMNYCDDYNGFFPPNPKTSWRTWDSYVSLHVCKVDMLGKSSQNAKNLTVFRCPSQKETYGAGYPYRGYGINIGMYADQNDSGGYRSKRAQAIQLPSKTMLISDLWQRDPEPRCFGLKYSQWIRYGFFICSVPYQDYVIRHKQTNMAFVDLHATKISDLPLGDMNFSTFTPSDWIWDF